jgi:hypothetical protein
MPTSSIYKALISVALRPRPNFFCEAAQEGFHGSTDYVLVPQVKWKIELSWSSGFHAVA